MPDEIWEHDQAVVDLPVYLPAARPPAYGLSAPLTPKAINHPRAARLLWALLTPELTDFTHDGTAARELLNEVRLIAGRIDTLGRRGPIDCIAAADAEWTWYGPSYRIAERLPQLAREGYQLLAALRWAELVLIKMGPKRPADFAAWCDLKLKHSRVERFHTILSDGRHSDHTQAAREMNFAALNFGVWVDYPIRSITFVELRAFADELCHEVAEKASSPRLTYAGPRRLIGELREVETKPAAVVAAPTSTDAERDAFLVEDMPRRETTANTPSEPPTIDRVGRAVLERLANANGETVLVADITAALDADNIASSDSTVRHRLRYLNDCGLVCKPLGIRKGFTLTPAGHDRLTNVWRIPD